MKADSPLRGLLAISPRRLLAVLATIFALLVPAAVAWACTPLATIQTDKPSYRAGEQMTVSGRLFQPGTSVTITSEPAGIHAEGVPVDSTGDLQTQLRAPDRPGVYTLLARSSDTPEFVARTAFEVVPPPPKQCSDGQDNDGDGRTDYPRDPGCSSPNDNSESPDPQPLSKPNPCTINGTAGHDVIRGTPGRDVICAGAGNDTVYGRGRNDIIRGGSGNDVLRGGEGNDRLIGGPGRDIQYGNAGADALNTVDGRGGNDVARGGAGADACATDPRDVRSSC